MSGHSTVTCKFCGKDFLTSTSAASRGRSYCSRACYYARPIRPRGPGKYLHTCPVCSATFRSWSQKSIYCGYPCFLKRPNKWRRREPEGMRTCPSCKATKPLSDYWKHSRDHEGAQVYCKACNGEKNTHYKRENPKTVWAAGLKSKHGITAARYFEMLDSQKGACAACGGPHFGTGWTFHVDHDHATGVVRGLLCQNCNIALGCVKDSIEHLNKLIDYVKGFHAVNSVAMGCAVPEAQIPDTAPT